MWLLEEMCKRCDVDTEFIDPTLTYYENKEEIQKEAHRKLFLKPDKRGPEAEMEEARAMVQAYEDVKDVEAERSFNECGGLEGCDQKSEETASLSSVLTVLSVSAGGTRLERG